MEVVVVHLGRDAIYGSPGLVAILADGNMVATVPFRDPQLGSGIELCNALVIMCDLKCQMSSPSSLSASRCVGAAVIWAWYSCTRTEKDVE